MGAGYWLGEHSHSGWEVKKRHFNKENPQEIYLAAANDLYFANEKHTTIQNILKVQESNFELVDYSEKAIAIFGDTKAISQQLKELGGKFNRRLTKDGEKQAGWIFSKKKEDAVNEFLQSIKTDAPVKVIEKLEANKAENEGQKYLDTAEKMRTKANKKYAELETTKANTPKRLRDYKAKNIDADILMEKSNYYEAVGKAIIENNLPEILKDIINPAMSKDCFNRFVLSTENNRGHYSCYRGDKYNFERYTTEEEKAKFRPVLAALQSINSTPEVSESDKKERLIKAKENELRLSKIEGFYPTPEPLIEQMVQFADLEKGDIVLEPSAGKGDIADFVKANTQNQVLVCERMDCLVEILELKGHNIIGRNALTLTEKADKILMNPPFEKGQDIEHVRYAFENNLKAGGKLVAIISGSTMQKTQNKFKAFQNWANEFLDYQKDNGQAFKDAFKSTGVHTSTIVLSKPLGEEVKETPIIQLPKKAAPEQSNFIPQVKNHYQKNEADKTEALAILKQEFSNVDQKELAEVFEIEWAQGGTYWDVNIEKFDLKKMIAAIESFENWAAYYEDFMLEIC